VKGSRPQTRRRGDAEEDLDVTEGKEAAPGAEERLRGARDAGVKGAALDAEKTGRAARGREAAPGAEESLEGCGVMGERLKCGERGENTGKHGGRYS